MADKIRVLILEDKETDADLVEFELMESGLPFTARRTLNEREFLQACEEFCPDLILSDYDLPQYSGALALAEARRRLPGVPFILVTGVLDGDDDRIIRILACGADGAVLKSRLDRLMPAVHKALQARRRN
ncbi:MAG TPA: response regulator [Syntrophales bacterium]|nr:response regulator [Syntrophales bacterium]